jgi:hypothetical protein
MRTENRWDGLPLDGSTKLFIRIIAYSKMTLHLVGNALITDYTLG